MYAQIKKKFQKQKFGRFIFQRIIKRYKIPTHIGVPCIKIAKIVFSFDEYLKRKKIAKEYLLNHKPKITLPNDTCYRFIGPDDLPMTKEIVQICKKLFEEKLQHSETYLNDSQKPFLIPMISKEDMDKHPEFLDFAMSEEFVSLVLDYCGIVPIFFAIELLYSPVNESKESSQLFHFDNIDNRYVKLFLNIDEVTEECGPLTFISADRSKEIREKLGFKDNVCGRISDEQVLQYCPKEEWIEAKGEPGSGVIFDNTHCLHFGSRCSSKSRLVATFEFMNYHSPFESINLPISFNTNKYDSDPVRSLMLDKIPTSGLRIFG